VAKVRMNDGMKASKWDTDR